MEDFSPELKKGSIELLILSLLESRPRHGYELGKLIEARSNGRIHFYIPSLYPVLCRMENERWIEGRWVEKAGQRRRRYYRLTTEGGAVLRRKRRVWEEYVAAINRVIGVENA